MNPCDYSEFEGWDWVFQDISKQPDSNIADWIVEDGDYAAVNQLHSAVIIQLFTNRRLDEDENFYKFQDLQGWWGDYYADFPLGSYLWTLYRAVLTDQTVLDAERYVREALQSFIEQGVCARVEIDIQANKQQGFMLIVPAMFSKDGSVIYQNRFKRFWNNDD